MGLNQDVLLNFPNIRSDFPHFPQVFPGPLSAGGLPPADLKGDMIHKKAGKGTVYWFDIFRKLSAEVFIIRK